MRLFARLALPVAAALAVLPLPAGAAQREIPVLEAIVGTNDGFDITLDDASGERVAVLPAGTYTVVVHDRSAIHNFHLASNEDPTVDFRTDVEFVGDRTFTATFRAGTRYAYACEPHWQVMNGSFRTERATTAPPPPPAPRPRLRRLTASVSAAGVVSLSRRAVAAGRYRLSVRDASRRDNFHLRGPGVDRRTGMAFRGSATWTVRLGRGTYRYGSDRAKSKRRLTVR